MPAVWLIAWVIITAAVGDFDHMDRDDHAARGRKGRQVTASCGPTFLDRIKALVLKEPDLPAQAIADRCGCSRSTVSMARAQLGLRKWRWQRRQHVTTAQDVDKGAPRCECGLLLPCSCEGKKRSAVDFIGRKGEQVIGSMGW